MSSNTTDESTDEAEETTETIEIDAEAYELLQLMAGDTPVGVAGFVEDLAHALPVHDFPGEKFPLAEHDWAMDRLRVEDGDVRRTDFFDSGYDVYKRYDGAILDDAADARGDD